jgi:RNase H-fold protein (predicted Holliday junction resolvase)
MLRKGIYDKVAAKIVLQKYLDFHHSPDEDHIK